MKNVYKLVSLALAILTAYGCAGTPGGARTTVPAATESVQTAATSSVPARSAPPTASPEPTATKMPAPERAEMPEGLAVLGELELKNIGLSIDSRKNIMFACLMLDGLRLLPGQELSLSAAIRRPETTGYWIDHVTIYEDPQPPGMARMAGALYNAALLAGLTVVERHALETSATYLPAGLEAAFNSDAHDGLPLQDLVIRNDKDASVWIRTEYQTKEQGDGFRVRILGSPWEGERPVSLSSTVVETVAPPEEPAVRTSKHAEPGKPHELKARDGVRVRVERVWQNITTGETRAEFLYEAYYPPVPRTLVYYPGEEPGG